MRDLAVGEQGALIREESRNRDELGVLFGTLLWRWKGSKIVARGNLGTEENYCVLVCVLKT